MQIVTEVFIFVVIVLNDYLNNIMFNVVRPFKKIIQICKSRFYKFSLTKCNFSEKKILALNIQSMFSIELVKSII